METSVGIDVSKDRLDVHILPQNVAFFVARNGAGLAELVERLRPLAPSLVVLEATGGFESWQHAWLQRQSLPSPCNARLARDDNDGLV